MALASEYFGSHVLDYKTMRQKLPKSTYNALMQSINEGSRLHRSDSDVIAQAMMEWALSKGVTHYTHWFQPMTGRTAQKHDAFLSVDQDLEALDHFSGSQLIQSEPDASSFPSGGKRSTFEARGYTTWDPSSPVFILERHNVSVLCIPSVFYSYTGHALDKKTPILRSNKALTSAAGQALKLLKGTEERVHATVGAEQEYFLIDRKFYESRPDLVMASRTLIGSQPPKGQQMEDHYFGSIKDRVLDYMEDVEKQLYRLGIPCKTRHNEVAPHQYEMAPTFLRANLSADQNQVVMEMMQRVASDHGLACLLHEKPFAGVNGSGKHMNWSLSASQSGNLLEPGKCPHENLTFLYFLVAVVHAIRKRGDLLRSTIASAGNDHRLGANEAPPAIMSVFLGDQLERVLNQIEQSQDFVEAKIASIDLGLQELPEILVDTTDRNRTSPFAFTGNKFEYRAVGAGQSLSLPIAFLNAAVAESLEEMNAELEKVKNPKDADILKVLRPFLKKSKPVRFEGNNYSEDWVAEAEKRGLSNFRSTPEALQIWENKDVREFLSRMKILTADEIDAHYNVKLEKYSKVIDIEASTLLRMVDNYVLPSSYEYQESVASSIRSLMDVADIIKIGADTPEVQKQGGHLRRITQTIGSLLEAREILMAKLEATRNHGGDAKEEALAYARDVFPAMEIVRTHCDDLERMVDAKSWSLPTYHEILFIM